MSVSRRDLLRWLAAAPALGAIDWTAAQTDRAAEHLRALVGAEEDPPRYQPRFFTPHEWSTVVLLVDYLIPRDERSGSASDAKVPEFMDYILADPDSAEPSRIAMRGGLAWLDLASEDRSGETFLVSSDAQRRALLDEIAWPKRARPEMSQGAAFFSRFRDFTASGFFSSAVGWKDLQYLGNVAVAEWRGCPPAALEKLGVSYAIMDARPTKR
jgi:gluconate 2-dehydrogenase gamma chain